MTEKELYIELLKKMNDAYDNLQNLLSNFDNMSKNLYNGLSISDTMYANDKVRNIKNDIISKRDLLYNTIIRTINEKINNIEE